MEVLFFDGSVVFNGHFPAGVVDHLGVVVEVVLVEGGFAERCWGSGLSRGES